jgi:arylsulfatase A-like enzyme
MRVKYFIPLIAVVALAAVLMWFFGPFRAGRPSIILISVDTLRPDHLGCYGYDKATSPHVDAFAGESILFERCFSQAPTTRPSCGTILSGYFPHELKIFNNSDNLSPAVVTVAERLRGAGYLTLGVVSNFVLRNGAGFEQGFDYYDDRMDDAEITRGIPERIAAKTTDAAIGLLRLHHKARLFMWIHYQDPHGPYNPKPPYDTMFLDASVEPRNLPVNATISGMGGIPSYQAINGQRDYYHYRARYDGEIRYFDEHFGRLLEEIKALGLYDNALIILTADHGEGMGEHDYYFAHGEYVYNSLIHVPLIVHMGGNHPAARKDLARLVDVVPTILGAAGVKPEESYHGVDMLAAGVDGAPIFSEMPGRYSVIKNGMKLIHHAEDNEYLLFDINTDPDETHDLLNAPDYEDILRPMVAALAGFRRQDVLGDLVRRDTQRLTTDEREKLKALGYVQ